MGCAWSSSFLSCLGAGVAWLCVGFVDLLTVSGAASSISPRRSPPYPSLIRPIIIPPTARSSRPSRPRLPEGRSGAGGAGCHGPSVVLVVMDPRWFPPPGSQAPPYSRAFGSTHRQRCEPDLALTRAALLLYPGPSGCIRRQLTLARLSNGSEPSSPVVIASNLHRHCSHKPALCPT